MQFTTAFFAFCIAAIQVAGLPSKRDAPSTGKSSLPFESYHSG